MLLLTQFKNKGRQELITPSKWAELWRSHA